MFYLRFFSSTPKEKRLLCFVCKTLATVLVNGMHTCDKCPILIDPKEVYERVPYTPPVVVTKEKVRVRIYACMCVARVCMFVTRVHVCHACMHVCHACMCVGSRFKREYMFASQRDTDCRRLTGW